MVRIDTLMVRMHYLLVQLEQDPYCSPKVFLASWIEEVPPILSELELALLTSMTAVCDYLYGLCSFSKRYKENNMKY